MSDTYESALQSLCDADPRIIVMTAENRAAIRNLPNTLGDRFIDVGICEQTMVGMAAGFALRGRIPIVHALAAFLTMRAFEFIRTDVGIAGLPVKLIGAVPGFLSEANGPTHQAIEDVAIMRSIPGMRIVCPADRDELLDSLPAIIESGGPVYVRYNARPAVLKHVSHFEFGEAEVLARGSDVTLLTYGFLLEEAMSARAILESKGVSVTVVNMRSLAPVDARTILRCALLTRLLVTIEDHFRAGGLYSIVAETLCSARRPCRVLPLSLEERWFQPALLDRVVDHEGFCAAQIAANVASALTFETASESGGKPWQTVSQ